MKALKMLLIAVLLVAGGTFAGCRAGAEVDPQRVDAAPVVVEQA